MKIISNTSILLILIFITGCGVNQDQWTVEVFESSSEGSKLKKITSFTADNQSISVELNPADTYQSIVGFGGSFTESSAHLLNKLSKKNRDTIIQAYFGDDGARYSLTRTHINSCDFSLGNYSYAPVEGDKELKHFSIDEDRDDIIPMIKDAMAASSEIFKIIASPWTAPPWMKDNKDWKGGKLLPEYYDTWSLFFTKYLAAYKKEGINIWSITVENEPLGNGNNWESMHYSPKEMVSFVHHHLGPRLEKTNPGIKILAYDQNRGEELIEWADVIYKDSVSAKYFDGFAVHWYASTYDWFPESLNYTHNKAPDKLLIQSEGCIDAEVPHWKDDKWYWSKEATDWGWDWAPEEQKHFHPKYVPVYRYARDMIGCLNSWVEGWVDWNMVLDRQGGPNWANNWCTAPVLVDPDNDEVYFTPLYYVMTHFSRFIRPGAVRIGFTASESDLMLTGVKNPDGSVVVVVLNTNQEPLNLNLLLDGNSFDISISGEALQTIVLRKA